MAILVTGGAGYIGSHTCVELLKAGYDVVVVDNLSNSCEEPLIRIKLITGKAVKFYKIDLLDKVGLSNVFQENKIESVIHFAGLKAIGESVLKPLEYYNNNIIGSLILFKVMQESGVKNIVFISSAAVYGKSARFPVDESSELSAENPYGRTKIILEEILRDLHSSDPKWNIIILRYFNPIGAHESGLIGEDPIGIPDNLVPYITQVASGKRSVLNVFGNDYNTPDGSGVRDYIHVVDLALGHIKALEQFPKHPGLHTYNIGTGRGYSVLELIKVFSDICQKEISYSIVSRRSGDIAISYADVTLANKELGWVAKKGITEMCRDAWRWQINNPDGYHAVK